MFKILEGTETDPEKKLEITINNVFKYLKANAHVGSITVHLWLSFSFVFSEKPPHTVLLSNKFVENATDMIAALDRAASRPIIVALCPDSMFNMIVSRTTRNRKGPRGILEVETAPCDNSYSHVEKLSCQLWPTLPNAGQGEERDLGQNDDLGND